jgi:Protein of unknown function (DUF4242)
MPRYLVERSFAVGAWAAAHDVAAGRCDALIQAHAREGATWLHSFVTPDRRRSFCIVESPSPEAIRVAAQATALPVDRITEVRVFDPYSL